MNQKISDLEKVNQSLTENLTKKAFEISEKFRFEQEYKEIIKKLQEQLDQLKTAKEQELKQINSSYQLKIDQLNKLKEKNQINKSNLAFQEQLTEQQEQINSKSQALARKDTQIQELQKELKKVENQVIKLKDNCSEKIKKAEEFEKQLIKESKRLKETIKGLEEKIKLEQEKVKVKEEAIDKIFKLLADFPYEDENVYYSLNTQEEKIMNKLRVISKNREK